MFSSLPLKPYTWLVVCHIVYFPIYIGNNHPHGLFFFSEGLKPPSRYCWTFMAHFLLLKTLGQEPKFVRVCCLIHPMWFQRLLMKSFGMFHTSCFINPNVPAGDFVCWLVAKDILICRIPVFAGRIFLCPKSSKSNLFLNPRVAIIVLQFF